MTAYNILDCVNFIYKCSENKENPVLKIEKLIKQDTGYMTRGSIQETLNNNNAILLVKQNTTDLIGVVIFYLRKDKIMKLNHIVIAEECRNNGLGAVLLECFIGISECKYFRAKSIYLKTTVDNRNIRFYVRHKFFKVEFDSKLFKKKNSEKYVYLKYEIIKEIKYKVKGLLE